MSCCWAMFLARLRNSNFAVTSSSLIGRSARTFSIQSAQLEKPLPPRIVIPEKDIIESFLKGSGPGGQKINKTSSAVQLKHIPTGIVVKNQATRSRDQNRKNARRILGEKLEELEQTPRWAATEVKSEKIRRKKASAAKKSRRKYRQLDEGIVLPEAEAEAEAAEEGKKHDALNARAGAGAGAVNKEGTSVEVEGTNSQDTRVGSDGAG